MTSDVFIMPIFFIKLLTVVEQDPTKYQKAWDDLKSCHGVLVPGGFGSRGLEGKIKAITHARSASQF